MSEEKREAQDAPMAENAQLVANDAAGQTAVAPASTTATAPARKATSAPAQKAAARKLPPIQKVYEAWTALADGRIKAEGGFTDASGQAHVSSSDGSKAYTVKWDGDTYASTDNATYWQGYAGYPVIAVLMLQGRLPCDERIARLFAGVPWKQVNDACKRDYAKALAQVLDERRIVDEERELIDDAAQKIICQLDALNLKLKRKLS